MKNAKRALAVALAGSMALSSFTGLSFASELTTTQKLEVLKDLKIIKGDSTDQNSLDLKKEMERYRSVVLSLRLAEGDKEKELNDYNNDGQASFKDAGDFSSYVERLMAFTFNHDVGIDGYDDGTFKPLDVMTDKAYAKIMLEALGYEYNKDFTWSQTADKAKEVGILKDTATIDNTPATLGEIVDLTYSTLASNVKGGSVTLGEKIDKPVVAPTVLEVKSVTASNLKEININFNKQVEKESATKVENYKLNKGLEVEKAELNADGMSVVLTVKTSMTNQEQLDLTIKDVKDLKNKDMGKTTVSFLPLDAELPEVTGVKFIGPKTFEVSFSEPIVTPASLSEVNVSIKTGNYTIGASVVSVSGKKVVVNAGTTLVDGNDYTIRISNVKDYAGYTNLVYSDDITYNSVKEAPTMTVVEANQEKVKVKFSTPVTGVTVDNFYHTFSAWKPVAVTGSGDEYEVLFTDNDGATHDYPLPVGTVEFGVLAKANGSEIKDAWNNKIQDKTYNLSITADRTAPEVKEIKVINKNTVELTFSEKISAVGDSDNYILYNDKNEKMSVSINPTFKDADHKVITLEFPGKDFTGKTLTLEVKDLTDTSLYKNKLAAFTQSVEFGDKEFAGVESASFVEKTLYITYKEAVSDTALDKSNYKLPHSAKIESISFFSNRVIKIVADKAFTDGDIQIVNVTDLAGNSIGKFATSITSGVLAPISSADLELRGENQLAVIFPRELSAISMNSFGVVGKTVTSLTYETNSDGKTVAVLTTEEKFDPTDLSITLKTLNDNLVDIFGKAIANDVTLATAATDKWAPEVAKDADNKAEVNRVDDSTVTVLFNENIKANSFGISDIKVDGKSISDFSVSGKTLTLTLSEANANLVGKKVTINRVSDMAGNVTTDLSLTIK